MLAEEKKRPLYLIFQGGGTSQIGYIVICLVTNASGLLICVKLKWEYENIKENWKVATHFHRQHFEFDFNRSSNYQNQQFWD